MNLEISKVVGTSTEKHWSQVHTFLPEEKEKLTRRGQLLAVINLSDLKQEIDIAAVGREIISRLHEEYYGELIKRPLPQLKEAVRKVCTEITSEAKIEISAASFVNDVLYIAIVGNGRSVLRRNGEMATILEGNPSQSSVETASGYLEKGDIFLLGSGSFFEIVAWGVIKAALETNSIDEAAEVLAPIVHGWNEGGLAAAILAKPKEAEEKTETSLEEPAIKYRQFRLRFPFQNAKTLILKAGDLMRNTLARFTNFSRLLKRQEEKPKRSKKTVFTVALVLFFLLVISIILGNRQRKHLIQEKKISHLLEQARLKKEEGETVASLNPNKAKELLLEAQKLVDQLSEVEKTNQKYQQFKKELDESLVAVLRERQVKPDIFFDLEFIKKGAIVSDFVLAKDQLLILDKPNLAIYSLNLTERKSAIVAGGNVLENASQLVAILPKIFVLTDEGLVQMEKETSASEKKSLVLKADKDLKEAVDLQSFGSNLYLLTKKTIWQFPATESGFGAKRNWLKEEGKEEFSQAFFLAIDGSIWVLGKEGMIFKFTRGVKDNFKVSSLDELVAKPISFYTDSELKNLYLLDTSKAGFSRIVVLDKSGVLNFQYLWSTSPRAQDELSGLVVTEEGKKIFLLGKSKIYQILP